MAGRQNSEPDGDIPVREYLRTRDLDEARAFCRLLFYDNVRVTPLGTGDDLDFVGEGVTLGPITVGEIRYGTAVYVTTPDLETAYHVLTPLAGAMQSRQLGNVVTADPSCAVVLQPVGAVELTWSADCRMLSVKVDRAVLEREMDAALGRQVTSPMRLGATFATVSGPGRSWAALVRLLLTELRGADGLLNRPPMARLWRDLVVSGLALTVEHPYARDPVARRPRTVKRALDAMHAEPAHPFTAAELASIAGVGIRVLQESFKQYVGMSPLTYLRRLRLEGVHAELTEADRWQVSVSEVAARWGFTHLGRFAGAYRQRYGVPPSQTLKERR
ncbi:MAG TPA: AraC family transcriptional regulator [Actinoplanes sp.]|nr:AraC family transcriptional regulator [Actinoplanes sp.]